MGLDDTIRLSPDEVNALRKRPVGPCPCECNSGGFCGGCGHAGCSNGINVRPRPIDRRASDVAMANVLLTSDEIAYVKDLLKQQADVELDLLQSVQTMPAERAMDAVPRFRARLAKVRAIQAAFDNPR